MPDVEAIGERFAALETASGGMKQLSVRDTVHATIGAAALSVDYGRPLARGRVLLGNIMPFDEVWRTGANAATQFNQLASREVRDLHRTDGRAKGNSRVGVGTIPVDSADRRRLGLHRLQLPLGRAATIGDADTDGSNGRQRIRLFRSHPSASLRSVHSVVPTC